MWRCFVFALFVAQMLGRGDTQSDGSEPTTQADGVRQKENAEASFPLGDCGLSQKRMLIKRDVQRYKRIVGGKPAEEGDWPWVAALLDHETEEFFCGGSLLPSYQHILTAFHCVEKHRPEDIIVRLGISDLSQPSEDSVDYSVADIILHTGFNKRTRENNIAILKLNIRVKPSDYIRSICLPTGRLVPGQMTFVAGWGSTGNVGPPSDPLMETTLPIWRTEICNNTLDRAISPLQVCAGWKAGDKDTCSKDGGSPMMIQTELGRWEVVGIVGANRGCGRANTPGMYTRVSAFTDWIRNKIRGQNISLPSQRSCGITTDFTTRIVGGRETEPLQWPWIASLQLARDRDHYCGGVLITDQHVLTGASCVKDSKASDIVVRLGEHDLETVSDSEQDFFVDRVWTYANYSHRLLKNDIAVLRLKEKITFSDAIKNVCLPPKDTDFEGSKAIVIGWGETSFAGTLSPLLLQAQLSVWSEPECQQAYPRLKIDDYQICASHKEGDRDSCRGDSGGPLLHQLPSGKWAVIGIVSGGQGCGDIKKPGIYTRVSAYTDWIKSTVLNNYAI